MTEPITPELQKFYDIFDEVDQSKTSQFKDFLETHAVNFNLFKEGNFIERSRAVISILGSSFLLSSRVSWRIR